MTPITPTRDRETEDSAVPVVTTDASSERILPSGDAAGAPPGDRPFRPDVEGLRALAVALAVLYHSDLAHMRGGYVGIEVFFVVSGFVITGMLLRERSMTGRIALADFYGRRARRILPASTFVLVATVVMSYAWLGFLRGDAIVSDAKAAILYVANFHFISNGTNYINSQQPPSPLQNYWSLSVEEQFYLLFPTLVILVGFIGKRINFRLRLGVFLTLGIAASLAWSIIETHSNGTAAYFSPLTRAWELALGCLLAVCSGYLARIPRRIAAPATWLGVAGIIAGGLIYNNQTQYPGLPSLLPVACTAVVIAGGTAAPGVGAERLLGWKPMRRLGQLSYPLYLWSWPLQMLFSQHYAKNLSAVTRIGIIILALVLADITYSLLENPIRHARILARNRWLSIGTGLALTGSSLLIVVVERHMHP